MAEIPYDEETTRDWDWFAVDDDGNIAVFATGTFRRLPESVRSDWQRAEELIGYFQEASDIGDFRIRSEFATSEIVRNHPKTFNDAAKRRRYLKSFTGAARKGFFSYDTVLRMPGDYYGLRFPNLR